jgi:hypothetical protein
MNFTTIFYLPENGMKWECSSAEIMSHLCSKGELGEAKKHLILLPGSIPEL